MRIRYQDPDSGQVTEIAQKLLREEAHASFDAASPEFHLAAAIAEYAEILKKSYWAKDGQMSDVLSLVRRVQEELPNDPQVTEFAALVEVAANLMK